jgi:hypothetical protein
MTCLASHPRPLHLSLLHVVSLEHALSMLHACLCFTLRPCCMQERRAVDPLVCTRMLARRRWNWSFMNASQRPQAKSPLLTYAQASGSGPPIPKKRTSAPASTLPRLSRSRPSRMPPLLCACSPLRSLCLCTLQVAAKGPRRQVLSHRTRRVQLGIQRGSLTVAARRGRRLTAAQIPGFAVGP